MIFVIHRKLQWSLKLLFLIWFWFDLILATWLFTFNFGLCTLYLLACQVNFTDGDSGLCCYVRFGSLLLCVLNWMPNFTERFGVHFVWDYKALAYARTPLLKPNDSQLSCIVIVMPRHCHALVRTKTLNTSWSSRKRAGQSFKVRRLSFIFCFIFSYC